MSAWIVVVLAGAGSFLLRVSIVALVDRVGAPDRLERLAAFVVPAAFAAIAAAALAAPVAHGGREALPPVVAVLVTGTTARRRPAPVALAVGLGALWLATAVIALP